MATKVETDIIKSESHCPDDYCDVKLPDGRVISPELGFTKLMVLLADSNSSYRAAAMIALVALRGEKVTNMIVSRLNDCAVNVRVVACRLIARIGARKAVPQLYDSLNDRQPYVVCAAAKALASFGDYSGYENVCKAVVKRGAHQMEALDCLNIYLEEKLPVNEKGLKKAINMLSEPKKMHLFTIH